METHIYFEKGGFPHYYIVITLLMENYIKIALQHTLSLRKKFEFQKIVHLFLQLESLSSNVIKKKHSLAI